MKFLNERYCYKSWIKRLIAFLLDMTGEAALFPFRLFRPAFNPLKIRRILLLRMDQIGDVMMTRPAALALEKRFPDAVIDWLVPLEIKALLEDEPFVRQVIGFQFAWIGRKRRVSWIKRCQAVLELLSYIKRQKYDLAVDFRGDIRNIALMVFAGIPHRYGYGRTGGNFLLSKKSAYPRDKHQVEANFQLLKDLGIEADCEIKNFPLAYSEFRKERFKNKFQEEIERLPEPRIVIHPGAQYPSKRWPANKYQFLISGILSENLGSLVLVGTREEKGLMPALDGSYERVLDLRGRTEIGELAVLFDFCDYFIGNDSGPAHLAAAQGMKVLVIFSGTNDARRWHPWTKGLHLVTHPVPCSPCESRVCPLKHHDCMEKIDAEDVLGTIKKMMDSPRRLAHSV